MKGPVLGWRALGVGVWCSVCHDKEGQQSRESERVFVACNDWGVMLRFLRQTRMKLGANYSRAWQGGLSCLCLCVCIEAWGPLHGHMGARDDTAALVVACMSSYCYLALLLLLLVLLLVLLLLLRALTSTGGAGMTATMAVSSMSSFRYSRAAVSASRLCASRRQSGPCTCASADAGGRNCARHQAQGHMHSKLRPSHYTHS